nr:unnamed protein product [Spirometra erinaceieuropaei]
MASFDTASPFTPIPQDLIVDTIELLLREKYDETENRLGHAQIIQLLKFCLKTYFTFDGTIYEQVKGTPMGSPISGLIAEAVLQRLESLVFRHHRPQFWARYVDGTFVVIERDQVPTFKEHLDAVFPDIQFTMEEEENNQLTFLDVLVCRKDCGGPKTKVFRKATNTTQILNFNNKNHLISHKRNCAVNTSLITTFGAGTLSLDIGFRRLFPLVFVVAGIPCVILGADFLSAFNKAKAALADATLTTHFPSDAAISLMVDAFNIAVLREMQDAWTARKAEEIQGYADRNEWKNFFSAIKAVYGPPTKGTAPLLSADGSTLLTEKTQILQRWAEHFRGVLNRPSVISDAAIARLPQVQTNADLDLPPSLQETIRAVQQLSSGKAPGSDTIPAEVYKHGGPLLMDHLTALYQEMWRQGEVPQDFKDAIIVHLYKRKGNRQVCDNHCGISLLNIAGKIFARILLNRLNNHLEQGLLPESQCGFRRHRGTTDMIFAARQLQEKCQDCGPTCTLPSWT